MRDWPSARPGRVTALESDGYYMVSVGGGEVPAYLSDRATDSALEIGSLVTVLTMIGGFEIVSAKTGAEGSGGITLGTELIGNGGFESGTLGEEPSGWSAFWDYTTGEPNPLSTSDDAPLSGLQVAMVTVLPGWAHSSVTYRSPSRIDPETPYRFTAYVSGRITAGTGVEVSIELMTAATAEKCQFFSGEETLQVVSTLVTPGEAWPLLSGDVTIPTGHTWFRPILRVVADAGSTATIRWDQASLRQRLT